MSTGDRAGMRQSGAAGLELVVSWETGIKCFRKGRPHQVLWEQVLFTL